MQPVVINKLLQFVPKRMWATCRLVCQPWHDQLLPRWRKHMKVRIGGMGKTKLKTTDVEDDDKVFLEVPSFVNTYQPKDIRELNKFPFRSVKTVAGQVIIDKSESGNGIPNKFWNLCGPWLHRLHFHAVMFNDVDMLKNIVFRLTPNLKHLEFSGCDVPNTVSNVVGDIDPKTLLCSFKPGNVQSNLKTLKISIRADIWSSGFNGTFPLSFLDLFLVFTNLEELCLKEFLDVHFYEEFVHNLLNVINTVRETSQSPVLNIKKLDIKHMEHAFSSDLVTKLFALSLPLEELHVEIYDFFEDLQRLLSNYSTLTKLVLINYENNEPLPSPIELSVLSRTLTHLELVGHVFWNWNFLTVTPHLTTLKVSHNGKYVDDEWEPIPFPEEFENAPPLLEFLTTFAYNCGTYNLSSVKTVDMFMQIMPNVKKLGLSVGCAGFKRICSANTWSGLTHLEIIYCWVKQATFVANIHKLTNLTCLKVNVGPQSNKRREIMEKFRNDSIQYGFLKLAKLERLSITFPHGIAKSLLIELYEKVGDTKKVYVVRDKTQRVKYPLKNIVLNDCTKSIRILQGTEFTSV